MLPPFCSNHFCHQHSGNDCIGSWLTKSVVTMAQMFGVHSLSITEDNFREGKIAKQEFLLKKTLLAKMRKERNWGNTCSGNTGSPEDTVEWGWCLALWSRSRQASEISVQGRTQAWRASSKWLLKHFYTILPNVFSLQLYICKKFGLGIVKNMPGTILNFL